MFGRRRSNVRTMNGQQIIGGLFLNRRSALAGLGGIGLMAVGTGWWRVRRSDQSARFAEAAFPDAVALETVSKLRNHVSAELTTTCASHYTREIDLIEMLDPDIANAYYRRATGEKYLLTPNRD
jgi:hypothetical protein